MTVQNVLSFNPQSVLSATLICCPDPLSVWKGLGYRLTLLFCYRKDDYGCVCRPFVKEGITVAVVNFDNAPKGKSVCVRVCVIKP